MMKQLPKKKSSAKVDHRWPGHYFVAGIVHQHPGITTPDLGTKVGIDYHNNFNKRAAKIARRLSRWVIRVRDGRVDRWYVRPEYQALKTSTLKKLIRT